MHDWHGPYYGFQHVDISQGHGDHQKGHYLKWLKERDPEFSKRELPALEFPDIGDLHPGIHSLENHPTTWCREKACEWIEDLRDPEMPFFLWVGIPDPHHPFTPPKELAREAHHREVAMDHVGFDALQRLPQEFSAEATEYVKPIDENRIRRIRQYTDVMVEMIDETVGKIRDSLEKSGILDDTIIVFTSDHGDFLGDYNLLRKCSAASGFLHRVPGIIWGAGSGCLTGETDSPTSSLDWFPTLCEEAGIPVPPDLHGVALGSRMGPLSDEGPAVMSQNFPTAECRLNMTIYEGVHRLTFYPRTGTIELYNSEADPEELQNLAEEPSLVMLIQRLKARLLENTAWASHPNLGRVAAW
jgi:arylsulfatase A-like enzyme